VNTSLTDYIKAFDTVYL